MRTLIYAAVALATIATANAQNYDDGDDTYTRSPPGYGYAPDDAATPYQSPTYYYPDGRGGYYGDNGSRLESGPGGTLYDYYGNNH
jgi:hypothetical protein